METVTIEEGETDDLLDDVEIENSGHNNVATFSCNSNKEKQQNPVVKEILSEALKSTIPQSTLTKELNSCCRTPFDNHLDDLHQLFQFSDDDDKNSFPGNDEISSTSVIQLNANQLEEIKLKGTVTLLPSSQQEHPPGTYKITPHYPLKIFPPLPPGTSPTPSSTLYHTHFLNSLSKAIARYLFVHALNCFKQVLSYSKKLWKLLILLVGLLFGLPSFKEGVNDFVEKKVFKERCKYLVAELAVGGNSEALRVLRPLLNFIRGGNKETAEGGVVTHITVPFRFTVNAGKNDEDTDVIDLSLFDGNLVKQITPELEKILFELNSKTFFFEAREKIIQQVSEDDINKTHNINSQIQEEYLKKLVNVLLENDVLKTKNVSKLLAQQVTAWGILKSSLETVARKLLPIHKEKELKLLKNAHTFLSRDLVWLKEREKIIEKEFFENSKFKSHEICLSEFSKRGRFLWKEYYFLERDLRFLREVAPILKRELSKRRESITEPKRVYMWDIKYGPLATSSTSNYLHRIATTPLHRYIETLITLLFTVCYQIPLHSRFAIATLYKKTHHNSTNTVRGIISSSWLRVSKERTKYENNIKIIKTSRGYKTNGNNRRIERIKNMVKWWSYGVALTTYAIGFAVVVVIVNFGCLVVAGTCVVWPLGYVILYHLKNIFLKDTDCCCDDDYIYFPLFKLCFHLTVTMGDLVFNFLKGLIYYPLVSISIVLISVFSILAKLIYGNAILYSLISPGNKIDLKYFKLISTETFTKKEKTFLISQDHFLSIVLLHLYKLKLRKSHGEILQKIRENLETFETWFETFLGKRFGAVLSENVGNNSFYGDLVCEFRERRKLVDEEFWGKLRKFDGREVQRLPWKFVRVESKSDLWVHKVGVGLLKGEFKECFCDGDDSEGAWLNLVEGVFGGAQVLLGYNKSDSSVTRVECPEWVAEVLKELISNHDNQKIPSLQYLPLTPIITTPEEEDFLTPEKFAISMDAFVPNYHQKNTSQLLSNPLPLLHPANISVVILKRELDGCHGSSYCGDLDDEIGEDGVVGKLVSKGLIRSQDDDDENDDALVVMEMTRKINQLFALDIESSSDDENSDEKNSCHEDDNSEEERLYDFTSVAMGTSV